MQWESKRKKETEGESELETLLETDEKERDKKTEGEKSETDILYVDIETIVRNGQWFRGHLGEGEPDRQKERGGGRVI